MLRIPLGVRKKLRVWTEEMFPFSTIFALELLVTGALLLTVAVH
jgi:hypothetical protein